MRGYLAILLLVMLTLGCLWATFGWSSWSASSVPPGIAPEATPVAARGAGVERAPESAPIRAASQERPPAPADGRVDGAEVTLRIGEGYVFGEAGVRPRADRDEVDVYCQDLRHGMASLRCRLGAAPALAPLTGIGLPETGVAVAALVDDAPLALSGQDLVLSVQATPQQPGVGFARARTGATFELCLVAASGGADALDRTARIRFEAVPAVDRGGGIRLLQTLGLPSAAAREAIRAAIGVGAGIPGQSFHTHLDGAYTAIAEPGAETTLHEVQHVVVEQLLHQKLELFDRGAVFVAGRMGREASIVLRSGGAAGVAADLEGTLRTDGYAFLFVGRDVLGTLDIRSYTTAVVLGDVRGTVRVRSYTDLYVRGRILGTLDLEGSGWCKFYFQSFLGRSDLERLSGNSQITLHVMQSDLAPGKHTGIGKWREVIVGDPLWQRLAR